MKIKNVDNNNIININFFFCRNQSLIELRSKRKSQHLPTKTMNNEIKGIREI